MSLYSSDSASSVMMKHANIQREVSAFVWLVILSEELFVQIILAAMGILIERFHSMNLLNMNILNIYVIYNNEVLICFGFLN
jgi:hypothetical protein